ncbi:MAG: sugar ABC transporter substrate-binding protein [Spirochaetaceae bacterium]|nr:MAG: sugar ABC transporter substrate-binding protein [Spirochaetaceae bacterium]
MKKILTICTTMVLAFLIVGAAWSGGQEEQPATQAGGDMEISFEGKTVDVLLMASPIVQKFENLVSDFEVKTGAKVNILLITPANYDQKADMELVSPKGAYDVLWLPWRTFHRWIKADWFAPMDQFMNNKNLADPALLDVDGFAPLAYQSVNVDGVQYALPIMQGATILHYRIDILEQHGLGAPPDTWTELEEMAKKVHSSEIAGVGMRCAKKSGQVGLHYPMVLAANGGSIVKDYPNDMHPSLDEPVAIESAKYFARLMQNYGFQGVLTSAWQENVVQFQQGKLAFYPDANVLTGQILDPEKSTVVDKTDFAVVPRGSAKRVAASGVHSLGVPKNSPEKELGYKFIEWALSDEVQFDNAMKHDYPALIRPELMMRKDFLEKYDWGDGNYVKVVSETFAKYADALYRPHTPEWRQIEEIIGIAMSSILTGQAEVEKALGQANEEVFKVFQEAGYY